MSEGKPDDVVLQSGEFIPDELPEGAAVFLNVDGEVLPIGPHPDNPDVQIAPPFADGCLGQHYPDDNPECSELR